MSQSATHYALSVADPFSSPEGACIPDFPTLQTGRFRTFAKGTFATSTDATSGGRGFIVVDPPRGAGNDANAVKTNTAAMAALAGINLTGAANVNTNSPYGSGSFATGNNQQFRVVSCGLRIRYIGSELIRGGQIIGLHHPAHYSLHTYNESNLDAYWESARLPVIRDWTTVTYRPVETDDLDWAVSFPTFTPAITDPSYYMGFLIRAPDTNGTNPLQFEYEAYFNYEISGPLVQNKEFSHSDAIGHSAVNEAMMLSTPTRKPHNHPIRTVANGLVTVASHVIAHSVSDPSKKAHNPVKVHPSSNFWSDVMGIASAVLPTLFSLL
jgi:hypothetical protein